MLSDQDTGQSPVIHGAAHHHPLSARPRQRVYLRVFCWADDTLYPAIELPGYGVIHDLDHVRDTVHIEIIRHRQVREILKLIKKTLPEHFRDCEPIIEGPD